MTVLGACRKGQWHLVISTVTNVHQSLPASHILHTKTFNTKKTKIKIKIKKEKREREREWKEETA